MTQDITNPSRRSVAKGAAWAVPAVAVAAAAPSLAASTVYCTTNTYTLEAVCPPLASVLTETRNVYFRLTNTGDCTIQAGLPFTLTYTGLGDVQVGQLQDIQVDAGVLFADANSGTITRDIPAGDTVDIEFFPDSLLSLSVLGEATLNVDGVSATSNFIVADVDPSLSAVALVAICA